MKSIMLSSLFALAFSMGLMAQTHPGAEARRFSRGVLSGSSQIPNPSLYQSVVIPADQQRGIELIPSGNNTALYGNAPESQLPWFCRIQRPTLFHLATGSQGNLTYGSCENPIAAFGELAGGTPLYLNRDYRFGAFAGFRNNAATPALKGVFRIRAYSRVSLASGQTNVAPASQTTFELPWPGDASWNQFLLDGARKSITFLGLTTTVEIVGGALQAGDAEQWNTWNDPYVITHRAADSDYFYVVEYKGWSTAGASYPMVTTWVPDITAGATFSPLYTLDFTAQPAWRSTFIHDPQFNGEAVPSWYYGRSLRELQAQWGFSPVVPAETKKSLKGSSNLDNSPELRAHPILDDFVAKMGNDPVALANYVFNEIALVDPVSYNEEGSLGDASIGCGGVNRGALATFLEKQGNPWEQCALLVYLLRKADVAAVYCEPQNDKLGMLDTQLSKILRMQIKGAQTPDGKIPMPEIIPTNYPWVAAWVASENRWVHLFPWLKDTEAIEGGNLYDQFPAGTKTGAAWMRQYIQGDTNIVPSQVAVYQQDNGVNGLAVMEAEGFHEHSPKNGKKWEPLDDTTPSGYSGVSWMRPMPESAADYSNAGFASQGPRLDYQINFTKTGTHYVWVRGYGGTGNDRVHVGLNGSEVSTADQIGDFGAAFQWRNKDTANAVVTINVPSAGLHTVNVWMARDGFRFDKLLLTTNASYDPSTVNSGNGPAMSKQTVVEPNVPSHLFPKFARANLGAGVSFDTLGMQFRDRRYSRSSWDEFPEPFQLAAGSHLVFDKLADRPDTFDTVRVQLWSDKNNDGIYNAGTDGALLDTGEWLSAELHNRRFYAATRKTGASAEQLRLYLAPSRATATGTGNFAGANKLQEQLLTATLGSTDNKLQFEITHRKQKKISKFGIVSLDVVAGGATYSTAPAVTVAAPPAGTGHRNATATATVSGGKVIGFTITDPGYGYATTPTVTLSGGGGSGASAKANLEDVIAKWTHPLGISVEQLTVQKPVIQKGDLAAICLNFGRVTDPMLRVHAEDFWGFERSLQATPTLKDNPDFQEKMQSTSAYLMGMAYYERVSRFKETCERLHKTRVLSMYAAGLSKLAAYRDNSTGAPIYPSGTTYPYLPVMQMAAVDMFFLNAAYASNASVHADSGIPFTESTRDFWHLLIGEISAQEHAIINDYYSESAAISTIGLLHRAKTMLGGIRRLTKQNYANEGEAIYPQGKGESVIWSNAVNANPCYSGHGSQLRRTTPGGPSWNADAEGDTAIIGDGCVEFRFGQANQHAMLALSKTNPDTNYTSLNYAIYGASDGKLYVFENGVMQGIYGTYTPSDVFRIERKANTIIYKKNGVAFGPTRTESAPLLIDTSFYNAGGAFFDCRYVLGLNAPSPVIWKNLRDTDSASTGSQLQGGLGSWGTSGASGGEKMSKDGFVEFRFARNDCYSMVGLSEVDPAQTWTNFKHAIYGWNNGTFTICESGNYKVANYTGTYNPSDVFCIERIGNKVSYKKNGVQIMQTSASPFPLIIGASIYTQGGLIADCRFGNARKLKDWDPSMWSAITGAFAEGGGDYAEVYVTPGPVRSASASYTGMGAMVFSTNNYAALISGNQNLPNGGSGSKFSAPRFSSSNLASNTLTYTSSGYNLGYRPPATASNPVVAPATISLWNVSSTISNINTSVFSASSYQSSSWTSSASLLGLSSGGLGSYYSATASRGSAGQTSFFGGVGSALQSLGGWVADPVNVVTGEFYHDVVDLTLPGPFPLAIRRNYSSQSLSENEFGHGWKLAYLPYLVVGDNGLIYGAEMDGSVIAYRQNGTNPNLYEPKTADNPSLKNLHSGGAGSTGNPLNNRLVKSTEGVDTIYTLTGPNGQTRRFKVRQFPVGTGASQVTRSRPYLETWKDASGNTLTFTYEGNAASPEYGLLTRISANNGNFLGFAYDIYGHIVEAWAGDGRRVVYNYDAQGDLRSVTLPDGAVHQYDYQQETTTAGGESVQTSTHLLVRETKPGGRILENEYDAQRRVTLQRAVVGDGPQPVRNATFIYTNSQNTTAGDPNKGTWSGTTTVRDAYNRDTVFAYTNNLVTSEDDPETPPEVRAWYGATETGGGAYPRSLKSVTDRRGVVTFFKYDARGNLVEKSLGTDTAPADLDGDGTASGGEKALTSWTYTSRDLPQTATEPSGVVTKWFYEDVDYPYLATRIETHAQGQLVSQTARRFYEKTGGTTTAFGLLQSERLAAGSPDEALTEWQHDNRGFPTRRTSYTGTGDPNVVVDLKHNLRGELVEEKDALGRLWTYTYDAMGRRTAAERRAAGGALLSWDYVYYNLNGEPEWTDGARYNPEDYTWSKYDGHGRLTEKLVWRSQSRADGQGLQASVGDTFIATTLNKYDLFNNLVEVRNPRGHSVTMGYDGIGRMTSRQFYQGIKDNGGAVKASESFTYEPGGEVATHTGVLGNVTANLYNACGQLRKRTNPDGSVEEWRYYPDGRLFKEMLRNGSVWETIYDDPARTATRQLKAGGTPIKTQVKVHDRRGNCISETADGHTFTKTYDGLNRLKTTTGPAATATSARQSSTYTYPDGVGREERVTNALNETTTTLRDALGRVESVEVRNAGNSIVSMRSYAYSPDHTKVTETVGSGAGMITTETWSDHDGQPALVRKADGTFELYRYDNGGLLLQHLDRAGRLTNYQRDWRGSLSGETRPGNLAVGYLHDAAGNLLERQMPGGSKEVNTFDSAGRMTSSKLTQSGGTTRLVNYTYHPGGHQWAGLLKSASDARGIATTMTYDSALRVATANSTGPDPEDTLTRTIGYNGRNQVTSIAEAGLNGSTAVTRGFDGYGATGSESVSVGGTTHSGLAQHFDAAGRRTRLTGAGADRVFAHNAAGQMVSVSVAGNMYSAAFGTNGLLTGRTNPFRSVAIQSRDSVGRVTDQRTSVGGTLALKETVPSYWATDKILGLYSERSGAGSWNESRDFAYDNSARLIYEEFTPWPNFGEDYLLTAYDGLTWGQGATGGIGVRTVTRRGSDGVALHFVPGVSSFARVTGEDVGGSQPRSVSLTGAALGAEKVTLTLDGRDIKPVGFPGWQNATGNWTANATLAPGFHRLTATATHASGWSAPTAQSVFQVLPRAESVTNTYDEMGNIATRTWRGGKVQALTWDPRGRLVKVVQTGVEPFVWTALYDGLDRRIQTTYTPQGGATVVTKSVFDPEVEFLEIGLAINNAWSWKVYGPDMSGSYGGLQGLGGLEAIIGSDGVTRGVVSDWFGNTVGHVAAPGGAMSWSGAQFLAWGAAPGWSTPPQDGTKPLHELLCYRGLTVDPTGYVQQGLRAYDPQVGRWLSPDPVGHAASLSLYDYCDNDPLNVFDPDGRFGKGVGGGAVKGDYYKPTNVAQGLGQFVGQVGAGFTPVGILGDVRDFTAAVGTVRNEGLNWRTGSGVVMGMAAFVPGFGDAAKGVVKPLLSAAPASPTIQAASTVGSVASRQAARAISNSEVTVYRVFGGDARAQGFSWTTVDPRTVNNFRNGAGLPSGGASGATNTADFLIQGKVNPADIIKSRSALPLDGNAGGLPELIIDPKNVRLNDYSVLKP